MDFGAYFCWLDIGVAIGLLAALFAGLQWKAGRNAAESARKSATAAAESATTAHEALELGQRAWVTIDDVKVTQKNNLAYPTVVFTTVKNGGNTPVIDFSTYQHWVVVPTFPKNPTYETAPDKSRAPLGPGSEVQLVAEMQYTPQEITQIREDKLSLYLYGRATYEDVFRKPHATHWCLIFRPETQQFSVCSTHNSVT